MKRYIKRNAKREYKSDGIGEIGIQAGSGGDRIHNTKYNSVAHKVVVEK